MSFFRGKNDEIWLRRESGGETVSAGSCCGDAVWLIELDAGDIPWVVRYSVRLLGSPQE
jgi:hypothetical protein